MNQEEIIKKPTKCMTVSMSVDRDHVAYLKLDGISKSEFFRQMMNLYKEGKVKYDRSKQY